MSLVFPTWWQALSAVAPSKTARDWWALDDARSPRYDRMYRVWGDPTDGAPPPYYKIEKEKHLVPTLWENFALFHPRDTVAALYREFNFEAPSTANDLCWSCEFNLGHQDRQLDIVMHVRFAERDEVVIGEAKAGRKRFDEKDLVPREVLSRDVFRFAGARRYFLLGDASPPADWRDRGYGILTWQRLYAVQAALCSTVSESAAVQRLLRQLIAAQFVGHGISTDATEAETNVLGLEADAQRVLDEIETVQCQNFIACAIQHIRCIQGQPAAAIPIAYLAAEPDVGQIRRRWRLGCGGRYVNEKAYWKLPARP